MRFPGFQAENALYASRQRYRSAPSRAAHEQLIPARLSEGSCSKGYEFWGYDDDGSEVWAFTGCSSSGASNNSSTIFATDPTLPPRCGPFNSRSGCAGGCESVRRREDRDCTRNSKGDEVKRMDCSDDAYDRYLDCVDRCRGFPCP